MKNISLTPRILNFIRSADKDQLIKMRSELLNTLEVLPDFKLFYKDELSLINSRLGG